MCCISNPITLGVPDGMSEYWDVFNAFFKVWGGAELMAWDMGKAPNISRFFNALAGEGTIKKGEFQYVMDNTKAKVIVPFCVCEGWSLES